jgi:hypothetical protein
VMADTYHIPGEFRSKSRIRPERLRKLPLLDG